MAYIDCVIHLNPPWSCQQKHNFDLLLRCTVVAGIIVVHHHRPVEMGNVWLAINKNGLQSWRPPLSCFHDAAAMESQTLPRHTATGPERLLWLSAFAPRTPAPVHVKHAGGIWQRGVLDINVVAKSHGRGQCALWCMPCFPLTTAL